MSRPEQDLIRRERHGGLIVEFADPGNGAVLDDCVDAVVDVLHYAAALGYLPSLVAGLAERHAIAERVSPVAAAASDAAARPTLEPLTEAGELPVGSPVGTRPRLPQRPAPPHLESL